MITTKSRTWGNWQLIDSGITPIISIQTSRDLIKIPISELKDPNKVRFCFSVLAGNYTISLDDLFNFRVAIRELYD
jgi:hypothetical protein